jgi:hypothetical protein
MLQAHSILWHYLWVAPNVLLLVLGLLIWKRGLHRRYPVFFAFAILSPLGQFALYAADVVPSISAENFWRVDWVSLLIEGPLKFALVGGIFANVFGSYASVARLGRLLIRGAGITLVLAAALAAAYYAPKDSRFGIIYGAHRLEQTIYLIVAGLIISIFLLSSYFHLSLERPLFGIALGLGISACVHLATWAIIANGGLANSTRSLFDFVGMATYHVCVLIWWYYLLVPPKVRNTRKDPPQDPPASPPVEDLEAWNQEMERLLHR